MDILYFFNRNVSSHLIESEATEIKISSKVYKKIVFQCSKSHDIFLFFFYKLLCNYSAIGGTWRENKFNFKEVYVALLDLAGDCTSVKHYSIEKVN